MLRKCLESHSLKWTPEKCVAQQLQETNNSDNKIELHIETAQQRPTPWWNQWGHRTNKKSRKCSVGQTKITSECLSIISLSSFSINLSSCGLVISSCLCWKNIFISRIVQCYGKLRLPIDGYIQSLVHGYLPVFISMVSWLLRGSTRVTYSSIHTRVWIEKLKSSCEAILLDFIEIYSSPLETGSGLRLALFKWLTESTADLLVLVRFWRIKWIKFRFPWIVRKTKSNIYSPVIATSGDQACSSVRVLTLDQIVVVGIEDGASVVDQITDLEGCVKASQLNCTVQFG